MNIKEQHVVNQIDTPIRFVDYAIGVLHDFPTKNAVKKGIKRNELLLNGVVATTGAWVKEGDVIAQVESNWRIPKPYDLAVPIVFEDDWLVVVNKPAGIAVSGNQFRTVENAMVGRIVPSNELDALRFARPVHRLDVATSGLLVFAKTKTAQRKLMQLFAERTVSKTYTAVLTGYMEEKKTVTTPIDGKASESIIQPLKTVRSLNEGYMTLAELSPLTGRTHQLRKHCSEVGHAVVGDTLYGKKGSVLLHKGLFLCATALAFEHPFTQTRMEFSLLVPTKFERMMQREEQRYHKYN